MPTDEGAQVIGLCRPGLRAIGDLTEAQIWSTTWALAIRPAYRHCADYLAQMGRAARLDRADDHARSPFVVLFWDGAGALAGMRVGLHLTYGFARRCQFDVSLVRDSDRHRYQTSLHSERFEIDAPDLGAAILLRCAHGMGIATEAEKSPLRTLNWRKRELVPQRLC